MYMYFLLEKVGFSHGYVLLWGETLLMDENPLSHGKDRNSLTSVFSKRNRLKSLVIFWIFVGLCDQQYPWKFTWGGVKCNVPRRPLWHSSDCCWFSLPCWQALEGSRFHCLKWGGVFCWKKFFWFAKRNWLVKWDFIGELFSGCSDPIGRLEGVAFAEIEKVWNKLLMISYIWPTQSEGDFQKSVSIPSLPSTGSFWWWASVVSITVHALATLYMLVVCIPWKDGWRLPVSYVDSSLIKITKPSS